MKGSILPLQSLLFTWRLSRPDSQLQARQSVNHSEAIHGTQTVTVTMTLSGPEQREKKMLKDQLTEQDVAKE